MAAPGRAGPNGRSLANRCGPSGVDSPSFAIRTGAGPRASIAATRPPRDRTVLIDVLCSSTAERPPGAGLTLRDQIEPDTGSGRYTRLSALKSACPVGAHSEGNDLLAAVRRSLKTQQHAHSSIEPRSRLCVQVRRRRPRRSFGVARDDGAKIDPVLRPDAPPCTGASNVVGARVRIPPGTDPGLDRRRR